MHKVMIMPITSCSKACDKDSHLQPRKIPIAIAAIFLLERKLKTSYFPTLAHLDISDFPWFLFVFSKKFTLPSMTNHVIHLCQA